MALQKPRSDVNQRNHMRLWLAPVKSSGVSVWVGQISRDIGVRLTSKTITTHKVDPQVDETRWYLLQDMFFAQGMKRFGLVKGVGASAPDAPRTNYTGDPYFTDGLRLVMWMSDTPVAYDELEFVHWEPTQR
jgi:LssY-like putative type I secretion system component LssY